MAEVLTADQLTVLRRRYSHFRDELDAGGFITSSVHRITRVSTPRPYLHLVSSNHSRESGAFGSFWDAGGAGFSCLDTVLAGPVTSHKDPSYVPTAPRATDHRHFYLRERGEPGCAPEIWHVFPQRGVEEDQYEGFHCDQGLGTVKLEASRHGLRAGLLVFVPVDHPLEVWRLTLENLSGGRRSLDLFLSVNWGLDSYPGYYFDPRVVSEGRVYDELNTLVALNHDQNNRHPRTGFLMASRRFEGFDMSAEDFTGGGHFRRYPLAVERDGCTGSRGLQPYLGLIGAMHFRIELAGGESTTLEVLLGVTDPDLEKGRTHLQGLARYYFAGKGVDRELERLGESWRTLIGRHKARTPDVEFDRFFNVWSKYQAKNTARWTRALDKVGYRDLLQDLLSINSFNPEYTSVMLPTALRYQFPDGRAVRQFSKFEGTPHDERMYMDSPSWIADTLTDYVQETGDFAILERREPFLDPFTKKLDRDNQATVYEHALRGLRSLFDSRGLYGLCRIGHGDWNDALDGVGRDGEGVSVWLSMALVFAAGRLGELAAHLQDGPAVSFTEKIIGEMTRAINEHAWDGRHYVYAFMPDGTPIGSSKGLEGKIHLNVNAWSLFNGVAAAAGRQEAVLASIEKLKTPLGYLLLFPAYTSSSRKVGRIGDMAAGQFENGSIYTHGQSFVIYALATLGRGSDAFRSLKTILPENTLPDIATGPPHQVSNFTVGIEHPHFGRNLYSNFSGALAWLRKSAARILGLLPDFDRLVIDPCIPSDWPEYRVEKIFRGCRVKASVHNPKGVCRGVAAVQAAGIVIEPEDGRAALPVGMLAGKKEIEVEVELGG
ncbi:MAG: hypothetical protein V1794_14585 [Candidatus Glassbacteria bacterium]